MIASRRPLGRDLRGLVARRRDRHLAAPAREQRRHGREHRGVILDHQHAGLAERPPRGLRRLRRVRAGSALHGFRERQRDREHRPLADHRAEADRMIERQRQPPHDCQTQAETLRAVLARLAPLELLEDGVAPLLGNAGTGVPHLDRPAPVAGPPADQHAAAPRVAQAVGDQVLHHPPEQQRIGRHPAPGAEMPELEPALSGRRPRLLLDQRRRSDSSIGNALHIRRHHAGVELGQVEQRAQELLERRQAPVRLIDQARPAPAPCRSCRASRARAGRRSKAAGGRG